MTKLKTSRYDNIRKRLSQNSKVIIVTMKKLKSRQNYIATKLKNLHCYKTKRFGLLIKLKHCENCKTLPREHRIGCQGVITIGV